MPDPDRDTARRALDCLEEIALQKGLDSVSMRDVAARVGISLSSLQYHYPNKAALIGAFVRHALAHYRDGVAALVLAAEGRAVLPDVLDYAIAKTLKLTEGGLFALIEARALHDPATAEAMHGFWCASLEGYAEIIRRDHPTLTPAEALRAATLIGSLIEGLASTARAAATLGLDRPALVAQVKRMALAIPPQILIAR